MKKFKSFIKAHWILVWLLVVVIAFTTIVSAEYIISKNRIRRVIANVPDEGQRFSSNYMKVAGEDTLIKVSFNSNEVGQFCVLPINIWNRSETNPQKAYEGVINYNWIMQLVDKHGNLITNANTDIAGFDVGYSLNGTDYYEFNDLTYDNTKGYYVEGSDIFNQTDQEGNYVVEDKKLYIRFPSSALLDDPEIYVKIVATPINAKGLNEIGATLGIQRSGNTITRGWSGTFGDDDTNTDYDAFNYVLSGSGDAVITLKWCTDYLKMNPISIAEYGWNASITSTTINNKNWNVLTFTADSDATTSPNESGVTVGINRYDIQFYMTGDPDTDYGSGNTFWTTVRGYVDFSAE